MAAASAVASACAGPLLPGGGPCELEARPVPLPPEVPESSGLAPADVRPGALWTHNDSGWEPVLFLVGPDGKLVSHVRVAGAGNVDWEDLAAGPCPEGRCLFIADTGDNLLRREELAVYRVAEPGEEELARGLSRPALRFPLRLPDGPRDIEAVALLRDGRLLLVSKGRAGPVEVYRTPQPVGRAHAAEPQVLERVQTLTARRPSLPRMVTGAAAAPDGRTVAVRTYEALRFYRVDAGGRLEPIERGGWVNLRPLREPQGEAVTFLGGGRLALSSEAGPFGGVGQMSVMRCEGEVGHPR